MDKPLTEDERLRLRRALAEAELLKDEDEWDSLDLVSALTVAEYELGIALDERCLRPGELLNVQGLEAALAAYGVRLATCARLRLDVQTSQDGAGAQDPARLQRERRQMEYRLALACTQTRFAVSRGRHLALLTCAADPAHLPLPAALAAAAGWTQCAHEEAGALPLAAWPGPDPDLRQDGAVGRLVEHVEQSVREMVTRRGGELWAPASPLIAMATLEQLGYATAHPEQIIQLSPQLALLPAACLNSYSLLHAERPVTLGTHLASVFRREPRYDQRTGRQPAFTCREILWCAGCGWEEAFIQDLERLLTRLAGELGIAGHWAAAHDPFFLADQAPGRKREFRASLPAGEVALASINRHGDHFISRGYGRAGQVTGCAGLGLERWALAAASWQGRAGG